MTAEHMCGGGGGGAPCKKIFDLLWEKNILNPSIILCFISAGAAAGNSECRLGVVDKTQYLHCTYLIVITASLSGVLRS